MASEPMTEAGKRLLDALWIAIDSANVQTLAFRKHASRMVAAIEAEARAAALDALRTALSKEERP